MPLIEFPTDDPAKFQGVGPELLEILDPLLDGAESSVEVVETREKIFDGLIRIKHGSVLHEPRFLSDR